MNLAQRRNSMAGDNPIVPPHDGYRLRAAKSFTASGKRFDRGAEGFMPADLGANAPALFAGRFVEWVAPHIPASGIAPRDLPVSQTVPQSALNPKPLVIDGDDPVACWHESLRKTMEVNGADYGRSRNALVADREGGELYRRAVRVQAERNAIEQRTPGRRIAAL